MRILFGLFLLAITACTTPAKVLRSQEFSQLSQIRSGLLIPAEVQGTPDKNCRMEVSDASGNKQTVHFQTGKDIYFVELNPGIYQVSRLACDRGILSLDNQPQWARFVVNDGMLSYFSLLHFNSPEKDVLIQHPDREQAVEAFRQTWKALPAADRNRVVLAQDGRKMNEKMQEIQKVSYFQYSSPEAHGFEAIKEPVLQCQQKELMENHNVLGKTEFQVLYKNKKLEKTIGGSRTSNTYSPQFFECVEKAFQSYSPQTAQDFKLTVTL